MRVVNIIGKGRGWWEAPHEGECWGINDLCLRPGAYVTRVFHLHDTSVSEEVRDRVLEVSEHCEAEGVPLVDLERYPLEEIVAAFGVDYFEGGSIPYVIALAVYEGYREIHLYGCNLELNREYRAQRACASYWLGVAAGSGCRVEIHGERSTLLRCAGGKLYGFWVPQGTLAAPAPAEETDPWT